MSLPPRQPNETVEQYLKRTKEELPKFLDAAVMPEDIQLAIHSLVHKIGINTITEIMNIHDRRIKERGGEDKMYEVMVKLGGPTIQMMEYQTNFFMSLIQVINAIIDYALATNTESLANALKTYRDDNLSKGSDWRPDKSKDVTP